MSEEALQEQPVQAVQFKSVIVIGGNAMFRSQMPHAELGEMLYGIMQTEHRVFRHLDVETNQQSMIAIPPGAMVEVMSMQRFETVQNERRVAALRQQAMQAPPTQLVRPR